MDNIDVIKDQICDVCHKMWQLGWVAANDGNVSVKLDDGRIIATPTGMSKSFITPDKLIILDSEVLEKFVIDGEIFAPLTDSAGVIGELDSVESGRKLNANSETLTQYFPDRKGEWDEAYNKFINIIR